MGSKSAIGIGNGICFKQVRDKGGGSYIDPLVRDSIVGLWIADQNNNDSATRNIIKNKIKDRGGDLEVLNAAYKPNSGYGKYEEDFTSWTNSPKTNTTDNKITVQQDFNKGWISYIAANGRNTPAFKVEVSGIPDGGILMYGGDIHTKVLSNGINELPERIEANAFGFKTKNTADWSKLTITQIPSFQGALVTDGVDDMIVSQKTVQEMLGGSNEITVVSMITHLSGAGKYNIIGNNRGRIQVSDYSNQTFIAGESLKNNQINIVIELGDKNKITKFDYESFNGRFSVVSLESEMEISSAAWYWTFIAKRALTTDEINQVIAYYNLDKYVKPDVYYDVKKQGLSNDTPDEDWYLKDYSGNGRDMQLYNFGKTSESGINEEGALVFDGVDDYGQYVGDLGLKDYTVAVDRAYVNTLNKQVPIVSSIQAVTSTQFIIEHLSDLDWFAFSFNAGSNLGSDKVKVDRKIIYQSTYMYEGKPITRGSYNGEATGLTIGRYGIDTQYANIALWSLLLFPYTLSEFLLERQLKRYKLGTLYPDMVEFRPIVNVDMGLILNIEFKLDDSKLISIGEYIPINSNVSVRIDLKKYLLDEVALLKCNGKTIQMNHLGNYWKGYLTVDKSPQKIDITIDEYIRYEDIVQPYPFIIPIIDTDGKEYTYGDKIKVGTEIRGGINGNNLLPELYKLNGYFNFNGAYFSSSNKHVIGKTNVFELTNAPTYLKANEPNCIADPQRLRIPNSSYKILGYIPDISGHGNHLKINNSAYAGMSGANGYLEDFTTWRIYSGVILTDSTIKINSDFRPQNSWIVYKSVNKTLNSFSVNIEGIPEGAKLNFRINMDTYIELSNGRNDLFFDNIPITVSSGFKITKGNNLDWSNLVIQQIGEYEGSFCLDGVEDYLTIPTLSHGGKQVLMKVNLQSYDRYLYDQRNNWSQYLAIVSASKTIAYEYSNKGGKTYIDGILNEHIIDKDLLNITHNITATNANIGVQYAPNIGTSFARSNFAQMALFTFMSFDEISSDDEIKELNDIVGIEGGYVESPDYYWDAYGKSNTQADDIDYKNIGTTNAKFCIYDKSITGLQALEDYRNGGSIVPVENRKLTLNKFAFNAESGYGGWLGIGNLTTSFTTEDFVTNKWEKGGTIVKGKNGNTNFGCGYAQFVYYDSTNYIAKFKIKVTGLVEGEVLNITQYGNSGTSIEAQQLFNGINEVTLNLSNSNNPNYKYFTFRYPPLTNDVDFEFLYEYQNGLVSDGVDDHLINTVIPAFTDFTVIAKRRKLSANGQFMQKGLTDISSAFILEKSYTGTDSARECSFGGAKDLPYQNADITFCTKSSYNGASLSTGSQLDSSGLLIGKTNEDTLFWKGVFYKMMLYSKTIDMLSINMLKNLFEKDELIDVNNPIFKKDEL